MSTVAEHMAVLEILAANNRWDAFNNEGWMFLQVHFRDIVAMCGTDMDEARKTTEQRIRKQHPDQADELIAKCRAAAQQKPAPPSPRPDMTEDQDSALNELAAQAQELDMGYGPITVFVYRYGDGRTQVKAPGINDSSLVIDMLQEAIRAINEGSPVEVQ